MLIDINAVRTLYDSLESTHAKMRAKLGRDLTLVEKILFSHMDDPENTPLDRGVLTATHRRPV